MTQNLSSPGEFIKSVCNIIKGNTSSENCKDKAIIHYVYTQTGHNSKIIEMPPSIWKGLRTLPDFLME